MRDHQFAERIEVSGEGPTKTYIDGPVDTVNLPGPLRHERLTTDELHVVQLLRDAVAERGEAISKKWGETLTLAMSVEDSLKNFTPLGWIGWGEVHWYADTPIYDALVAERGDPL